MCYRLFSKMNKEQINDIQRMVRHSNLNVRIVETNCDSEYAYMGFIAFDKQTINLLRHKLLFEGKVLEVWG